MNINENKYFEWKEKLFAEKNPVKFVRLAFVIYTKVNEMELNDATYGFPCKCYIDNLLVTKTILKGVLQGNEYVRGMEENIVRTLGVLHRVRTRLAPHLLERESSLSKIRHLDKTTYIDTDRCLLHIKSREFYSSQYEFEKFDDGGIELERFRMLFHQVHANRPGEDKFINNIDTCLRHNPFKRADIRGYRADQSSHIS
jgi:hypothetical protein